MAVKPIVYTVLGMCHSGTSCLAECMIKAGVEFGSDLRGNVYEHRRIALLHARMMPWDDPSRIRPRELKHDTERDAIVASFNGSWGFKEPLTLFTTDFWREVVDLRPIGTFRDPRKVATRFATQFGPSRRLGDLYAAYNNRLLEEQKKYGFPLLCFDDSPEEYDVQLYVAFRKLGLGAPPSPDLSRRKTEPKTKVLDEALEVYEKLRDRM